MAGCGPAELGVKMLPSRVTALPSGSARTGTEIVVSVVSPAGASVAANAPGAPAYTQGDEQAHEGGHHEGAAAGCGHERA